jgi:HEAT repeat protein
MRLRLAGCLLSAALSGRAAAVETAIEADLDGDGRAERISVDDAGTLRVRGSDGKAWGELRAPAVAGRRGATTIDQVASAHGRLVHAHTGLDGAGAIELVALVDGRRVAPVYAGVTGPRGADGESGEQVRVDAEGALRYQTAPGVARCDGFDQLFPELYDPAAKRFRKVTIPPPTGTALTAVAVVPPGTAPRTLGLFRFVAASTFRGDAARADRLLPPRELDDGRDDTAWVEGLPGGGRGAFVTARARVPGQSVTAVKLTRGPGNLLARVALLVGGERFTVALAPGRVSWIALPSPVAADCVTVAIDEARPDAGDTAIAEASIYTTRDGPDGVAGLVRDVADGARGAETFAELLSQRGPEAVAAIRAALPGTTGEARRRLLRVAVANGSDEAAALLVGALPTADAGERDFLRQSLDGPLGARAQAPLLQMASDPSQPPSARSIAIGLAGPRLDGDAAGGLLKMPEDSPEVRAAVVALANLVPVEKLLPAVAASAARHPDDAARILGILGGRARHAGDRPRVAEAAAALLALARPDGEFALRFRALRAAGQIGAPELVPLVSAAAADRDETLRWVALEAAGSLDGEEGVALLRSGLRDVDPRVRLAALTGLAAHHAPEIANAAVAALDDRWPMVRRAAAEWLGDRCPGTAAERLVRATNDEDLQVARTALASLVRCAPAQAAPIAVGFVSEARRARELRELAAAAAATLHATAAVEPMIAALDDLLADPMADENGGYLVISFARALGQLADPRAEPALQKVARERLGQVRAAGVEALTHFKTSTAAATVKAARSDKDPSVRKAAGGK